MFSTACYHKIQVKRRESKKNYYLKMFYNRCPPEYVYLYREFGGSLWIKDSRNRLATEISDRAPALSLMKQLQGMYKSDF